MKEVAWRHSPVGGQRQTTFEDKNGPFTVRSEHSLSFQELSIKSNDLEIFNATSEQN